MNVEFIYDKYYIIYYIIFSICEHRMQYLDTALCFYEVLYWVNVFFPTHMRACVVCLWVFLHKYIKMIHTNSKKIICVRLTLHISVVWTKSICELMVISKILNT